MKNRTVTTVGHHGLRVGDCVTIPIIERVWWRRWFNRLLGRPNAAVRVFEVTSVSKSSFTINAESKR